MIDGLRALQWQKKQKKSAKFRDWDKLSEGRNLIFGDSQIPLNYNVD